jgi:NAD(P)-dependent dehydrogenase (short-subunit alcohol dehydrogenase family)
MKDFSGKIAVVTGGGSGMGRELVRQLVAEGCAIAMCDVSARGLAETQRLCYAVGLPQGLRITSHVADVSNEADVLRFRDEVSAQHAIDRIHLLFNNAGISGGGSMIVNERPEWERTFNICWGGVYLNTRAFLPMLRAADEAHIVNTSSMNGFWASVGPDTPHTAYSAAKFAVKGFTEALIADFRMNAPHIRVSVVMPGHIGTGIRDNSLKVQTSTDADGLNASQIAQIRARLTSMAGTRRNIPMPTSAACTPSAPTALSPTRQPARPRRRRSSWTVSGPTGSASWSGPTPTSLTAWCARTPTTRMSRSSTSVSIPRQAGIRVADGGALIGIIGGRPLSAQAVFEHGQHAPGEPVAVLGARGLETTAFVDGAQAIALSNGDTFGPECARWRPLSDRASGPCTLYKTSHEHGGIRPRETVDYPARPMISPRWPYRSPG